MIHIQPYPKDFFIKLFIICLTLVLLNVMPVTGRQHTFKKSKEGTYEIIPQHTEKVNGVLINQTEILNIHWLEYTYYKGLEISEEAYLKLLPDSINFWYRDPYHRYRPVVFVSYEQVLDYCRWRSETVRKLYGIPVTYRLPTKAEWEMVANTYLEDHEKDVFRELKKRKRLLEEIDNPSYLEASTLESDGNNMVELFSNVSEMVAERGIAKGMNHHNFDLDGDLMRTVRYTEPNAYLGFRCVAEVTIDKTTQQLLSLRDQKVVAIALDSLNSPDIPVEIGLLGKVEELKISLSVSKDGWTTLPPLSWYQHRELEPPFRRLPTSVRNLKKLKSLTAAHLDIHHLPDSLALSKLRNLRNVDLSFNKLDLNTAIPTLMQIPRLKVLRVIGNRYDEEVMEQYIKQYPDVKLIYKPEE